MTFNVSSNEMIQFTLDFDNINLRQNAISEQCTKHYYLLNNYCNYDKVLHWCKSLNLLPDKVIDEIKIENTKNSYYGKLQKLSNNIYQHLDNISHKDRTVFGTILENLALSDNVELIEYTDEVHPEPHLLISEIKITERLPINQSIVPVYEMRTKDRGILFFVNIIHFPQYQCEVRSGAQHDKFYLISLFRKFGFKIYYYENLLVDTFLALVNKLIQTHLNGMESLVLVVASHGNLHQEIEFYYGGKLGVYDILFHFSNRNCAAMNGKPKVFIFPCCRGETPDFGVSEYVFPRRGRHLQTDGLSKLEAHFSDILICYATVHGFVATRCVNNGNCYIEAFYRVLAEMAFNSDIESMLYTVKQVLEQICRQCNISRRLVDPEHKASIQTPSCVRWDFNKLLYFNPGYIE